MSSVQEKFDAAEAALEVLRAQLALLQTLSDAPQLVADVQQEYDEAEAALQALGAQLELVPDLPIDDEVRSIVAFWGESWGLSWGKAWGSKRTIPPGSNLAWSKAWAGCWGHNWGEKAAPEPPPPPSGPSRFSAWGRSWRMARATSGMTA